MNREFKFRVWDKTNKVFYHLDSHSITLSDSNRRTDGKMFGCLTLKMFNQMGPEIQQEVYYNPDNFIIQQFTGLQLSSDMGIQDIYEGDIVGWELTSCVKTYDRMDIYGKNPTINPPETKKYCGLVTFGINEAIDDFYESYVLGWYIETNRHSAESLYDIFRTYYINNNDFRDGYGYVEISKSFKILGNIFENPELLK